MNTMSEGNALRGRLGALQMSITEFARQMGWSRPTARKKIDGAIDFKASEIAKACEVLGISLENANSYFFADKVAKMDTKTKKEQ